MKYVDFESGLGREKRVSPLGEALKKAGLASSAEIINREFISQNTPIKGARPFGDAPKKEATKKEATKKEATKKEATKKKTTRVKALEAKRKAAKNLAATVAAVEAWDNTQAAKTAIGHAAKACLVAEARLKSLDKTAKKKTAKKADWVEKLADKIVDQLIG